MSYQGIRQVCKPTVKEFKTKPLPLAGVLKKGKCATIRVLVLVLLIFGALDVLQTTVFPLQLTSYPSFRSFGGTWGALTEQIGCRVQLVSACDTGRTNAADQFTSIYRNAVWGTSPSSHTRSGSGSNVQGAYETIVNLEPKFRELNVTSIADVPSGDCGWQFALTTINSAQAYFGGDITPHVAQQNAETYKDHLNKIFAFWDLVECPIPRWSTSCDATSRSFDVVIVRDVIQHMTIQNAMKAVKSIVEDSGARYLALTSYTSDFCKDQCKTSITNDGDWYANDVHCGPWNFPEPFFKFASHLHFPEEGDFMELYRIEGLKTIVSQWPELPCDGVGRNK
jgi:hypothetical protein